jgi:hypothetical protein
MINSTGTRDGATTTITSIGNGMRAVHRPSSSTSAQSRCGADAYLVGSGSGIVFLFGWGWWWGDGGLRFLAASMHVANPEADW